jgi:cobalamin biosynthesis protein CobD/CbiB
MARKLNVRVRENNTEVLYGKLLMYAEQRHQANKRRIRNGLISLIVIPVILTIILLLTDSSRIVFLLIWIACMFVVAAFLLFVAYSDWDLQTAINELSRDELGEFDNLISVRRRRLKLLSRHDEEGAAK